MDVGTPQSPEDDQPSSKKADGDTHSKRDPQKPNRIIAWASVALAAITLYIAIVTTLYAKSAREQAASTTDMLATMQADQRPWVGYHRFVIQARESSLSPWVDREPMEGDEFRVRLFVRNSGKSPALNVRPFEVLMAACPIGKLPENEPGIEEPSPNLFQFVLFPGAERTSQNSVAFRFTGQQFSEYYRSEIELFWWTSIHYCDSAGRLHWTDVQVSRTFGSGIDEFILRSMDEGSSPSEGAHPSCG